MTTEIHAPAAVEVTISRPDMLTEAGEILQNGETLAADVVGMAAPVAVIVSAFHGAPGGVMGAIPAVETLVNDARAMIHPAHAMLDELEDELSRMTGYARLKILPLLSRIRAVL